ncbi:MAG: RNA polymerase sigma factor [Cyclobacteriaceae bacterium]|nr:RNA polymerase sigma factor [Cyclobacteriaceae bacterium]
MLEISYKNKHAKIIDRCIKGDQKAYFEIYKLYSKAMFNICCRIIGNQDEAEDVLQEAFVNAFQNIKSYQGKASFGAWLKKIVVNKAISHLRKHQMEMVELEDRFELKNDEEVNDIDLVMKVETIREAIQKLPNGFRVVFSLYLLEGYDHKEISEILEISESTSKSQYNRAKKKLREIIKEEVYYG